MVGKLKGSLRSWDLSHLGKRGAARQVDLGSGWGAQVTGTLQGRSGYSWEPEGVGMMQAVWQEGQLGLAAHIGSVGSTGACSPHIRVWGCSLSNKSLSHKILNIPLQSESYCHSVVEGLGEF